MINNALLVEQLKRFWAIPAISAVLLFFTGLMPIYSRMNDFDSLWLNFAVRDLFI